MLFSAAVVSADMPQPEMRSTQIARSFSGTTLGVTPIAPSSDELVVSGLSGSTLNGLSSGSAISFTSMSLSLEAFQAVGGTVVEGTETGSLQTDLDPGVSIRYFGYASPFSGEPAHVPLPSAAILAVVGLGLVGTSRRLRRA